MFPFISADRYGPKQACKHICWVLESSRKFFHATQRWEWCSFTVSFGTAQNHRCTNLAWGGMKYEKWASAHVWNRKMRLKHRLMFPFVSADRYGPKQACKHICWVLESSRKFFHATQRWEWWLSEVSFRTAQNHLCIGLAWGGYEIWKMSISSHLES